MTTPYWMQDAVFYQIFPDRFADGDRRNNPPNVKPWGTPPTAHDFQGGDLRGIIQKFDYLLDLGINAIYLNPIFLATSTHRYNTSDYYKIDPKLGTMLDFHALLDVAHRNNVRIVLDGVFNHVGRGFFAFNDVLENNEYSAYKDWFHIHHYPLDAYTPGESIHFEGWWRYKSLPKLNFHSKAVRAYVLDVARYWVERGIDGWRLDVPNEIDDDPFWAEFRQVVKTANRDACLIGEIWNADPRWANDTHFDGVMNYPVRDAVLACLNGHENILQFADRVEGLFKIYPWENILAMYVTLGSHDTERILTMLYNDLQKVKLAFTFLFAYPGAPAIYYGDEVGLEGGKDPDSRRAFPWDAAQWRGDLRPWVQTLINIRQKRASLRRGEYQRVAVDPAKGWYAFARTLGEEKTIIVLNTSAETVQIHLTVAKYWREGCAIRSLLDYRPFTVQEGKISLTLAPHSGIWLG